MVDLANQSVPEKRPGVREGSEPQNASSSTEPSDQRQVPPSKRGRFEIPEIPSTVQFHGKRGITEELRVRNLRAKIAERQAEKRRAGEEQNEELAEKKRRKAIGETAIVKEIRSVDISEIYSPQRVTSEARRYGLRPGEAMDITTGWDFRKQEDREKHAIMWKKKSRWY